jgi:UDP-glucose 4-epimerase
VDFKRFRNKNILITGGLGFIGSNLAITLVHYGARVTVVDAMTPGLGGNLFNISPVRDDIVINYSDVRDRNCMNYLVREKDYIFHLAGQNDHVLSQRDPFPDLELNIMGTATVLEACRHYNRDAVIVYIGTRGEYGSVRKLPVSEEDQLLPDSIYGFSNHTAQKLCELYARTYGLKTVALRLTNVYGERAQMRHDRFGVANWFIRLALDNDTIKVFGDGSILRDFTYVGDVVDALMRAALSESACGDVINIGHPNPVSFLEYAKMVIEIANSGRWEFAPFTPERASQNPGDFYTDNRKAMKMLGWEPSTSLEDGLRRTIEYYRKYRGYYW